MILSEFVAGYENPNIKHFNMSLINREQDEDLKDQLIDVFKSLDVIDYIKFISCEYVEDAREIDMSVYSQYDRDKRYNKTDGKEEEERTIKLHESKVGELRVKFQLTCKSETKVIEKRYLIPLIDEYGYYLLNGKRFFLIYQLVDSSTYVRGQSVVLKSSILPVSVNREYVDIKDVPGNIYSVTKFTVTTSSQTVDMMYYYFAKFGVTYTLLYMGVNQIMSIVDAYNVHDEENLYFSIRANMLLRVNKEFFEKFEWVQQITASILATMNNRTNKHDLENLTYWIERLGSLRTGAKVYNYYEKGKESQMSFERLIDLGTRKKFKLSVVNKDDTYTILRWMMQNYESLRKKDDMNLNNKRLRSNEFIAGFLTAEFSKRAHRIIKNSNRITMRRVESLLAMNGDIIISKLHRSGLFRSNEAVDDMDFFTKLSFTSKGPNALGNNNGGNTMAVRYRGIDTSYISNIDIMVCGSSDPGASGVLTPFAKIENLNFNNTPEPQDGIFEFQQALMEQAKTMNHHKVLIFDTLGGATTHEEYMKRREKLYSSKREYK